MSETILELGGEKMRCSSHVENKGSESGHMGFGFVESEN